MVSHHVTSGVNVTALSVVGWQLVGHMSESFRDAKEWGRRSSHELCRLVAA